MAMENTKVETIVTQHHCCSCCKHEDEVNLIVNLAAEARAIILDEHPHTDKEAISGAAKFLNRVWDKYGFDLAHNIKLPKINEHLG